MIRSNNRYAENSFDGLTTSAEITVIGGNPRQIFSPVPTPGTFEDDRRMVPCILYGHVSVADPANVMSGNVELTGIEWYDQEPKEGDYTTGRITNPSVIPSEASQYREIDYLISDGSGSAWCSGVPAGALIIHKNVASNNGLTIYGVLKYVDQRTGYPVRELRSIDISTSGFDNDSVILKGPDTAEIMIDALSISDTIPAGQTVIDIPWTRHIDVQLNGAEGNVADGDACYLWLTRDAGGDWREFTEVERTFLSLTGIQTKRLQFDARFIEGTMELRCVACRRAAGGAWVSPTSKTDSPFWDCRVTQNMNWKVTADPVQRRGSAQDVSMRTPFSYAIDIRYNGKPIPANKLELFRVSWKVKGRVVTGGTARYDENSLGWGPTAIFVPADYGYTYADGFTIWAEVYTFKGCRPVVNGSAYVVQGGAYVFAPTFE